MTTELKRFLALTENHKEQLLASEELRLKQKEKIDELAENVKRMQQTNNVRLFFSVLKDYTQILHRKKQKQSYMQELKRRTESHQPSDNWRDNPIVENTSSIESRLYRANAHRSPKMQRVVMEDADDGIFADPRC